MMTPDRPLRVLLFVLLALGLGGCDRSEGEGEVPTLLKTRFETEMKTILHDVKAAQESAAALEGNYLELDELRKRYLNRVVPETYTLTVTDVSATGFRAEITHGATGLSCRLEVGVGSGRGVPTCD